MITSSTEPEFYFELQYGEIPKQDPRLFYIQDNEFKNLLKMDEIQGAANKMA